MRSSDVVFKSPELIERRVHHYPVATIDINNIEAKTHDDSDSDDYARRKLCRDNDRQDRHNNDCCDCNVELRRDIERLKRQVNRIDESMNKNMNKIVSLLERNLNGQPDGRKIGISSMSYTSHDGDANTSV